MWAKLFTPLSIPGKKYNTTPRSVVFILIYLRKYYEIRIYCIGTLDGGHHISTIIFTQITR